MEKKIQLPKEAQPWTEVEVLFIDGCKVEVLPKSWTKVMRQSHFEFCIGQDLTHSIFL